jgi:hypothetical protein
VDRFETARAIVEILCRRWTIRQKPPGPARSTTEILSCFANVFYAERRAA